MSDANKESLAGGPESAAAAFGGGTAGGILGGIAAAAPSIFNIAQSFRKPEVAERNYNTAGMVAAAKMQDLDYNINPAVEDAKLNFNSNKRNLATRSRGEQMAGTTALQGNLSRTLSKLYADKANAKTQSRAGGYGMASQVGGFNAGVANQASQFDAMNRATPSAFAAEGLSGLSALQQQRSRDEQSREMDKLKAEIMGSMYGGLGNTAFGDILKDIQNRLGTTKTT